LNVFTIEVPPLAARREDVPRLAEFFLRDLRYPHPTLPPDAAAAMSAYHWPGNVRELRNVIERATILAQGQPLLAKHFTVNAGGRGTPVEISADMAIPDSGIDLEALEASLIRRALEKTGNNKTHAAKLLGMTRRTLYSRMEKHGMRDSPDDRDEA
jgi:DNA-binding NtrC family response regulator